MASAPDTDGLLDLPALDGTNGLCWTTPDRMGSLFQNPVLGPRAGASERDSREPHMTGNAPQNIEQIEFRLWGGADQSHADFRLATNANAADPEKCAVPRW